MRLSTINGSISVRSADGPFQPYETFSITLNPDGGRTLRTLTVSPQGGLIRDVNQNVTRDWLPTSGTSRLFVGGENIGSVSKYVIGDRIHSVVHSDGEVDVMDIAKPERFSLGFHPIADEAWKMALIAPTVGTRQPLVTHSCSATWNGKTIGHGETLASEVEYVGLELAPAGGAERECRAYLWFTPFGKVLKIWVLGEHNVFVRLEVQEGANAGTVYELVKLGSESW